jgi:hypothetical protein
MTFKSDLFRICAEVARKFEGWEFQSSGVFRNEVLHHTDQVIFPGFHFTSFRSAGVDPVASIHNKRLRALYHRFTGRDGPTLAIRFSQESADYRGLSTAGYFYPEVVEFRNPSGELQRWPECFRVLAQAESYFRKLLTDGIGFLHAYFDLTTEENLLRHLPTHYKWMEKGMGNSGALGSFYEGDDGIMLCLAALCVGDFEFLDRYASDDFKTTFPKNKEALEKIIAALPEFRRSFESTDRTI